MHAQDPALREWRHLVLAGNVRLTVRQQGRGGGLARLGCLHGALQGRPLRLKPPDGLPSGARLRPRVAAPTALSQPARRSLLRLQVSLMI